MHDVTLPKKAQCEEELLRVGAYGPNIQSHVFAKSFDDVAKVHTVYAVNVSAALKTIEKSERPQRLEHKAEMTAVLEGPF
jgi:hypothetical protein